MNVISNNSIKCNMALQSLYNVMDPEIGLNVVDLGLIYRIDFDEKEKKIICEMTLTSQFCPMGESISGGVTNALKSAFPDYEALVELTFDPPWSYERISEEGRLFLNG